MRARGIKPGFYKNEQLAACSPFARLLFPGLWMMADKNGCLEYRPMRWKAEVFPYDALDCAELFAELEGVGLVVRYHVEGVDYAYIPKFKQHQNPHKNEAESGLPPYCPEDSRNYASDPEKACSTRADSLFSDSLIPSSSPPEKDSSLRSESSCPGSAEPDVSGAGKAKSGPKPKPDLPEDSEAYRLAVFMRDELQRVLPTFKPPEIQNWAREFDVALRNDARMADARFVAQVIRWVANDEFWRCNCQSPGKLRKQFDQLAAKMEREAAKARASPQGGYISPAQRRQDANREAGRKAKELLFGNQEDSRAATGF